jgi:hypothetical protein
MEIIGAVPHGELIPPYPQIMQVLIPPSKESGQQHNDDDNDAIVITTNT